MDLADFIMIWPIFNGFGRIISGGHLRLVSHINENFKIINENFKIFETSSIELVTFGSEQTP